MGISRRWGSRPTLMPIHDDRKLPALTGLRFFAAFAVLLSHFTYRGLVEAPQFFIDFLDGGRTAVSLFFVLSGFILAYNYEMLTGTHERRTFYVNRIARIFPVVLLSLAVGAIGVTVAVLNPGSGWLLKWYSLKSADPMALAVSFISQATMTTGWFPTARINQPWNGPAWSIACEMFFYMLFPFLIVWFRTRRAFMIVVALAVVFAIQLAIILGARAFAPVGQRGFLVSQFPPTHLFDFVVGIAAAVVFLRGGKEWVAQGRRRTVLLSGSFLSIICISLFKPVDPGYLLLTPLFAVLILALAVTPKRRASVLSNGTLLILGEASFSLYLIHVPLMNLYSVFSPPVWAGWLLMAATVAMSVFVLKRFESPARRFVKQALTPSVPRR